MPKTRQAISSMAIHAILVSFMLIALWPIFLTIINSFKSRKAIFGDPMGLPGVDTFSLKGFEKVLLQIGRAHV